MTEQDWLECSDPKKLLYFLRDKGSDRKFRLFACACCRHIWRLLKDDRSRKAVEVAERFAEGEATRRELSRAGNDAHVVWNELASAAAGATDADMDAADAACRTACYAKAAIGAANRASHCAAYALSYEGQQAAEQESQCSLLRDIFGNPFRPVTIDPSWLTWHDGLLVSMAQRMYDSRDFSDMPVLADALEESGCQDQDILAHCRSGGEHVRGCWLVDLFFITDRKSLENKS
ncbi:MAG TPA: hypothetical protein VN688_07945 [Gemmataceae bacterium]|nr:hypothetical protein [Gemmataceae bacterium]